MQAAAQHFGLKSEPFSIAPDPRYLFMSERHREALAHLLYGVGGGGGFVLLTGEIGAGKTTVCRAFLEQIPRRCNVAYIFNPKLTVMEMLRSVCEEFGIPGPLEGSSHDTVKGHKIGLTSKAMQSALNIDEPDSGILLDDMFFADGGLVPSDRFIATRIEAELAFVMKSRLSGPDCTMFDVLNATDFVVPALEILDTRVERVDPQTKSTRKIFDTIADNAANAGIVLGGRPIRPMDADLRWIGALCFRNGQLEETGLAVGFHQSPSLAEARRAREVLLSTGELAPTLAALGLLGAMGSPLLVSSDRPQPM